MITNEWFMGFIEGEGSFIDSPRKANSNENKYYPRFAFSITQKEYNVLKRVQDFLVNHNIKSRLYESTTRSGMCWLHVENKEALYNLCKFLDNQEWGSDNKHRQYLEWKPKVVSWLENGYMKLSYN